MFKSESAVARLLVNLESEMELLFRRRAHGEQDADQVCDDDDEREVRDSGTKKVEPFNLCLRMWRRPLVAVREGNHSARVIIA